MTHAMDERTGLLYATQETLPWGQTDVPNR